MCLISSKMESFKAQHDIKLKEFKDVCKDFVFGLASAAYQYEGAAKEGGRGQCIWDTATQRTPEKVLDQSNGNMAVNSYHLYKEDVKLLKTMGVDFYRFSISWSRILPIGAIAPFHPEKHESHPIRPPQHKDTTTAENNNVMSDDQDDFILGSSTLSFPQSAHSTVLPVGRGAFPVAAYPPGCGVTGAVTLPYNCHFSCHDQQQRKHDIRLCIGSEPYKAVKEAYEAATEAYEAATEAYKAAHHLLLAHANVVDLYRKQFKPAQKGQIGITMLTAWFKPHEFDIDFFNEDIAEEDCVTKARERCKRALDFYIGWFMEPLTKGKYPDRMIERVKPPRLPKFKEDEKELLMGSYDFIGIQYYTSFYVMERVNNHDELPCAANDPGLQYLYDRDGKLIGPPSGSTWLHICPDGIQNVLKYIKKTYNNPVTYITENGVSEVNDGKLPIPEALNDQTRIECHKEHLYYLHQAMKEDGVNVKGYFAWSLLDNFEWSYGYLVRFGMVYVDYKDGYKRYPKLSALWFKNFLKGDHRTLKINEQPEINKGIDQAETSKPAAKRSRNK